MTRARNHQRSTYSFKSRARPPRRELPAQILPSRAIAPFTRRGSFCRRSVLQRFAPVSRLPQCSTCPPCFCRRDRRSAVLGPSLMNLLPKGVCAHPIRTSHCAFLPGGASRPPRAAAACHKLPVCVQVRIRRNHQRFTYSLRVLCPPNASRGAETASPPRRPSSEEKMRVITNHSHDSWVI